MQLYQFPHSPFAAKVRKCLELKGLAYEVIDVPYLDRRVLLARTGGSVQVPVLADGDTVLGESARITAYLDERYAPSLRAPPHLAAAGVYEQWADNVLEDVAFRLGTPEAEERFAAVNGGREDARALYRVVKERKYGAGCIDAWRASAGELTERLRALLAPLGQELKSRPFLLGDRPTLADTAVWGQLYLLEWGRPGRLAALFPELSDWYQRLERHRSLA